MGKRLILRAFLLIGERARTKKNWVGKANGAQGRNRTTDTAIFSRMLYQLSYLGAGPLPIADATRAIKLTWPDPLPLRCG